MMLSDFDVVNLDNSDRFQGVLFLVFILTITVILFNLLNALAIRDTREIINDAELVDARNQISIIDNYEKLFEILKNDFACVFPRMTKIFINRDNNVMIRTFQNEEKVTSNDDHTDSHTYENVIVIKSSNSNNSRIHVVNQNINRSDKEVVRYNKFLRKQTLKLDDAIVTKIIENIVRKDISSKAGVI